MDTTDTIPDFADLPPEQQIIFAEALAAAGHDLAELGIAPLPQTPTQAPGTDNAPLRT